LGEPELRTTPAGTSVLRLTVDAGGQSSDLALAAVITGYEAQRLRPSLQAGAEVRVKGSLKAVRRRLKSGLIETVYEVMADSIELEEGEQRRG
jgi:hypothetical protein